MQKTYEELLAENTKLSAMLAAKARVVEVRRQEARRNHALLDHIRAKELLPNDTALARLAGLKVPQISKIRARIAPVTAGVMVKLHEAFGVSFKEMRELLKDEKVEC